MKKAIIVGFILTIMAVGMPYLLEKNYVNQSEWNFWQKLAVLWFLTSIAIYFINSVTNSFKQIDSKAKADKK